MTTPTGTIGLADVNVELTHASGALITMDDFGVRSLANKSTGAISMNDLRGKPDALPADVVNVSNQYRGTNWMSASIALGLKGLWVNAGGDWTDGVGTFNGPIQTAVGSRAGTIITYNIAGINGDLMLQGLNNWDTPMIDGVPAIGWWVDSTSNAALALPTHYGDPGFVLNPTRGSVLTVSTTDSTSASRVDRATGPAIAQTPMGVQTEVTPSLVNVDITNETSLLAAIGTGNYAVPYAYAPEYLTDPVTGLHYIRVSSPDGVLYPLDPRLISWFFYFTPSDEAYCRYCLYIEPDVAYGMTEAGMKLPGLAGDGAGGLGLSWRMEHGPVAPANLQRYKLTDYRYDYVNTPGGGYGLITDMPLILRSGQWYVIEQRAVMNTLGVADGIGQVWVNGTLVSDVSNINWRGSDATAKFNYFHCNIYHGGLGVPSAPIHYRVARIGVGAARIGIPAELAGTTTNAVYSGALNTWATVAGTECSSTVPAMLPAGYTDIANATTGLPAVFNEWSGAALDPATGRMWFAGAGHTAGANNGLYEFNLETMTWRVAMPPSIYNSTDLTHSQDSWNALGGGWVNYGMGYDFPTHEWVDGKPCAEHSYGGLQWRSTTSKVLYGTHNKWEINPLDGTFVKTNNSDIWISDNNSIYDSVTDKWWLFYFDPGQYWGYRIFNCATNTMGSRIDFGPGAQITSGVQAVKVGRKIWLINDGVGTSSIYAWTLDMDTGAVAVPALTNKRVLTLAPPYHYNSAAAYSSSLNKIFIMQRANGNGVFGRFTVIDVATLGCSEFTPAGVVPTYGVPGVSPYSKFTIYERVGGAYMVIMWGAGTPLSVIPLSTVWSANNPPTGSVTISGTTTQGQTLTAANTLADADGIGTITYQWKSNGVDLSGATGTTLVLGAGHVGTVISVRASYTDALGTPEAVTSADTATIASSSSAVTFDAVTNAHTGTAQNPSFTHTPSAAPSGIVILVSFVATAGATITSVTYGGVACTLAAAADADYARHAAIYTLASPPSGAQTVQVNFPAALSHDCEISCISVTGNDTTTMVRNTNTALANSTTPSVIVSSAAGDLVVNTVICTSNTSGTSTGGTERMTQALTSGQAFGATQGATGASATAEWGLTGGLEWAIVAASIKYA